MKFGITSRRGASRVNQPCFLRMLANRRGISILLLVLIVLMFVSFYAFQHIYNAQTRSRQAHKLFFASAAMDLAEAAVQLAILHVNNEMNDVNYNDSKNFWYSSLRKGVNASEGLTQDLRGLIQVKMLLDQLKDRGAKIKELSVTLTAVDKFYDLGGNPESFRDIEKCGSLEFKCVAEYMGTGASLRARKDFKVVHARNPILNNYVLFIKDSWGEYSSCGNMGYPAAYKSLPGSHEGYNPKDRYLRINSQPESNLPAGRVLFGGPMDSDKKIIINLSDKDTDLMDEVWPNGGAVNKIWGPNSKSAAKAGGDPKMPAKELEALYRSMFHDSNNPLTDAAWTELTNNTVFLFKKKNCGFSPQYTYDKNTSAPYPKSKPANADSEPKTSLQNMTDLEDLAKEEWVFGAHTSNYLGAMLLFADTVMKPSGAYKWVNCPQLNNQDAPATDISSSAKIARDTFISYNHSTDTLKRGIDLFGAPGERQFGLIEGNVWQRYSSLATLAMEVTLPPPDTKTYNINFVVPGVYYTTPRDAINKNLPSIDFKAFMVFLDTIFTDAQLSAIYITGANIIREENGKTIGRPFHTLAGSSNINYNSEIIVRPYNMGVPAAVKVPLAAPEAACAIIPPPRGFEELTPVISSKNAVIYENETEFFKKCVSKAVVNGATVNLLNLHGNVIIKSDLHLVGAPFIYKGYGTITVAPDTSSAMPKPRHIYIGTKIAKAGPIDLLCLYSSWGTIAIISDNLEINASLVALHPFYNPAKNLISFVSGPNISSSGANNLKIKGNLASDHLNLAAFPKNTTIEYDPLFHEMKTEDDYFVSVSNKFSYWVKEPL